MKKAVFVLILVLGFVSGIFCQTSGVTASSGPEDLIVVLDTSASMSSSYRETSDYLIGPFLKEFLRIGDTFHLISFSDAPKLEISRRIEGVGDVETVIARLLLMYPLDPESDIGAALNFSENYSSSLPGGKSKRLVLFSDGDAPDTQTLVDAAQGRLRGRGVNLQFIKVPVTGTAPSSGRPAQTAAAQPVQTPASAAQTPAASVAAGQTGTPSQSQSAGTTPPVAQTPGTTAPSQGTAQNAGQSSGQGASSQGTPAETPSQTTLPAAGTQTAQQGQTAQGTAPQGTAAPSPQTQGAAEPSAGTVIPAISAPGSGDPIEPGTTAGEPSGQEQAGTTTPLPLQPTAPQTPASTSQSSSSQPAVPSGVTPPASSGSGSLADLPLPLIIALAVLALLLLALIIFLISRRLHNSPNQAMARAAGAVDTKDAELMGSYAETQRSQSRPPLEQRAPERKPLPKDTVYKSVETDNSGPLMLNLFVADQNTAIGRRNIHSVKSGYTFSVGGGKSDFLIFLVPVPPHIADVQFDGRNCTFIPRKPQYFPDIGSQQVANCIGKTIRVISDKNYELHIRIERYEDPLKALNKMLHSITVPGPAV